MEAIHRTVGTPQAGGIPLGPGFAAIRVIRGHLFRILPAEPCPDPNESWVYSGTRRYSIDSRSTVLRTAMPPNWIRT